MKLLAFTDVHGDLNYINRIKTNSKKVDLLVCSGDLSFFGANLKEVIEELNKINRISLIIHGNHDDYDLIKEYTQNKKNIILIHKDSFIFDDFLFIGYGGGGFLHKDPEFVEFTHSIRSYLKKFKKIILITHDPPFNSVIDLIDDFGLGNVSYREFIDQYKERVVLSISGHFHENQGKSCKIENTLYVNPGPSGKVINL